MAQLTSGEEAIRLFQVAGEKYAKSIVIKNNYYDAYNNWGEALYSLAQLTSGKKAIRLFSEAEDKFLLAEKLKPGKGAYNLACIESLRNNSEACRKWLEKSRDGGALPEETHMESDSDLEFVRNEPWFLEFMKTAFPE